MIMAAKACNSPLIRTLAKRHFSSAKLAPSCTQIENKVLPNHIVVSSAPSPIKGFHKVAVIVRAGSRYETPDNYGAAHLLRVACGLSTENKSHFAIVKNIEKIGASLTATTDRETIMYTLNAPCDNLETGLNFLKEALTNQQFRPWELADLHPRIKYELASLPTTAIIMDLAHKTAFRSGLGNSLFVKKYNIKKLDSETLKHFTNQRFQNNKIAVIGVGPEYETVVNFANGLSFSTEESTKSPETQYFGGESRIETDQPLAHIILACQGAPMNNKDAFTYGILRHALGAGPSVSWGLGSNPLAKINTPGASSSNVGTFNISYSDAGLFGILISTPPENAKKALLSVLEELSKGVTDKDVERGKAQLKAAVLYESETAEGILTDLAHQAVLLGGAKVSANLLSEIDNITTSQVQQAQSKLVSGPRTLVAYGNIHNVPYLSDC